ncbi:MAG: SPFH domain-containing protein, partial [Flavobacteriaceae bacterium]|nr:SPFH domain-containing protein [Flavobacteriaceae bacterium]
MEQEKTIIPANGYLMLFAVLALLAASLYGLIELQNPIFIIGLVLTVLAVIGFIMVQPNNSRVLLLFGKYVGSVKKNGFYWVNPFYTKKKI